MTEKIRKNHKGIKYIKKITFAAIWADIKDIQKIFWIDSNSNDCEWIDMIGDEWKWLRINENDFEWMEIIANECKWWWMNVIVNECNRLGMNANDCSWE